MIFMEKSFLYIKLEALFQKHSADGTTPRKIIEANMAREFRLAKLDIHNILEEMHLEQEAMRKRRLKRDEPKEYAKPSTDTYQRELRAYR